MNPARDHVFAGAVLADDQHAGVRPGDAIHQLAHLRHRFRARYQRGQTALVLANGLGAQALGLLDAAAEPQLQLDLREQALVIPGFLDVVARPPFDGLHGARHRAPGRHDQDR
jgi:hypothetical protein